VRTFAFAVIVAITSTSIGTTGSEDDARLPPGKHWTLSGGHWGQSRYSTPRQIDTDTVKRLGGAWHVRLTGEHVQSTPVVRDGSMYVTGVQDLYPLARTGATVWAYRSGASGSSGRYWGVALGGGLVFLSQKNTRIIALDQRTGAIRWSHRLVDADDRTGAAPSLDSPPTYAGGLVISGLPSGDQGIRGHVIALDARTGAEVWRFNTIPGQDEIGHDAWPSDNDAWRRGAVWHSPAVDVDLGLVYFQTEFGADGPVMTYEAGGEQYVALTAGGNVYKFSVGGDAVWAFKLGGTIGPVDAPRPPTTVPVPGKLIEANQIEIGSPEEHFFMPMRTRVTAGSVVTWTNKGSIAHGAEAQDGSWRTDLVTPGDTSSLTFDRPGVYTHACPAHPWAIGELVVQPAQTSDPWIGTWRLNVARSSFSPGPPPRVQILDIQSREADGLYVVTNGTDAAGRPTHTERTAKFDGRDYPAQGFEQPTTQAFTRVDARSYSIVSKAGGRIITRTRVTVSPDGMTMTTVTTGDVGQGPINNTQVLEKQTP
jgi:plastocyanin